MSAPPRDEIITGTPHGQPRDCGQHLPRV